MASLEKVREETDTQGFVECDVHGATLVFRPVVGSSIKSIESLVEEFSDKIENPDSLSNSEIHEELRDEEHNSKEINWKPYFEIAIEAPGGEEILITLTVVKDSSYLDIYSVRMVDSLDSVRVRDFEQEDKDLELRVNYPDLVTHTNSCS